MALTRLNTNAYASTVDLTSNVTGELPDANIGPKLDYRNIIINGDMAVAQRATSTASITSAGFKTVDRFYTGVTTAGTWTQSQDTDVPSGEGFATSLKMDCTTADGSLAAGDLVQLVQYVEGQNLQYLKWGTAYAQSLTLSFWVKSVLTGTYIAELRNSDNTRTICSSYTISSGSTWEKKTITFAGDTNSGPANDNGEGLRLTLWLAAGSTYTSGSLATSWQTTTQANRAVGQVNLANSTSNNFWITGIQLEAGSTSSDFEFLPYDVNLERCQRYFQSYPLAGDANYHIANMSNWNGSTFYGKMEFITTFRADPTWTRNGGDYRIYAANANALYSSGNIEKVDTTSTSMSITPGSTVGSAGDAGFFWSESSAKNEFSAEL